MEKSLRKRRKIKLALINSSDYFSFKKIFYLSIFRERGREGKRGGVKHRCVRNTLISCLSHAPNWRPGPQPRHVP